MKRREKESDQSVEQHLRMFSAPPVQEIDDAKERTHRRLTLHPVGRVDETLDELDIRRPSWKWRIGLAGAVAAIVLAVVLISSVEPPRAFAVIEKSGATVAMGEVVRADVDGSTLVLTDGSRVEMRAQSELVLERADDGMRIRLNKGDVIVSAAKQHGHLYVQTRDLQVSVVGTVFLVKADDNGSRVAVIEGEVRVQQGDVEKSLLPGEQLASDPKSDNLKFFLETGWSREAFAYLSKLHESMARQSPGRTTSVSDKPKFEEASIRLCEQDQDFGGEGRGAGGTGSIRLSPGRVDALCMTVPTLINMAHRSLNNNPGRQNLPMNVTGTYLLEDGTHVRGGPDWVRSEKYAIVAIGDSTDGPTLQGPMLLELLERRFKLKLRVETEETPVYALTIAKGGLKIKPLESVKYEEVRKIRASLNPGSRRGTPQLGRDPAYAGLLGCFYPTLDAVPNNAMEYGRFREALRHDGQRPLCGFSTYGNGPNRVISSGASPISLLVDSLSSSARRDFLSETLNGLLVVDKTGLPDTNCLIDIPSAGTLCAPLFNFVMEFAADESFFTRTGVTPEGLGMDMSLPKAPTIFAALEKLGLHLDKSKAPREFILIEHIERPSPN